MDEAPRFHFFSLTFLVGFGVGAFIGVAFGLMAFAVVGDNSKNEQAQAGSQPTAVSASATTTATPARARTNAAIDVRIGPGSEYAAIGTISKGEALDIFGRDSAGEWVAVRFPPGSTTRGWLPVKAIDDLSGLNALAVVAPTPLPRSVSTPVRSFVPGGGSLPATNDGDDGSLTGTPVTTGTPAAGSTAAARLTPTARVQGQPDLAVTRALRLADGRVQVVVANRGGDLTGHQVMVIVADPTTRSETLRASGVGLAAGASVTLESDSFLVTSPTTVIATVDPSYSVPDADRGNNTLTTSLAPPVAVTPTPDLATLN